MKSQFRVLHFTPAYNEQANVNLTAQLMRDSVSMDRTRNVYSWMARHSCDLNWSRNKALHEAVTGDWDYLVMQDADVYSPCPMGPVAPLLSTCIETEATVVGALVTARMNPPRANVWPVHPGRVYECDKIGTGIVLIDLGRVRRWYADLDGPCFWRTYKDTAGTVQDVGQDIFFSYLVRDQGGMVVCDARIPTVHVDACHRHTYDPYSEAPEETELAETSAEPSGAEAGA